MLHGRVLDDAVPSLATAEPRSNPRRPGTASLTSTSTRDVPARSGGVCPLLAAYLPPDPPSSRAGRVFPARVESRNARFVRHGGGRRPAQARSELTRGRFVGRQTRWGKNKSSTRCAAAIRGSTLTSRRSPWLGGYRHSDREARADDEALIDRRAVDIRPVAEGPVIERELKRAARADRACSAWKPEAVGASHRRFACRDARVTIAAWLPCPRNRQLWQRNLCPYSRPCRNLVLPILPASSWV
jgi:hypothetical protein